MEELRTVLAADPDGTLALLYSAVVRKAHRRQLGTFFTPSNEVKLMLDLWTNTEGSSPKSVIDVGAGVGVFTAEAAKRWPEARVFAVDINPITLGLLAVRLFSDAATSDAEDFSTRVKLVRADYTDWIISDDAPPPGGRLILGNPPYTRAQLLSLGDRQRLARLTDDICGSRASLSTLITALSIKQLGPSDGLSLLLPAQWLESHYARDLRAAMWNDKSRRVELRLVESEDLFGGAQVDAVALLIGTKSDEPRPFRVARWREASGVELDRAGAVPASWRPTFDITTAPAAAPHQLEPVPLSELAGVHRGVATGANATFVISAAEAKPLPVEALTRVVTRLNELPEALDEQTLNSVSDRAVRYLLTATEALVAKHPALRKLVDAAIAAKVNERVLCARRTVWFDLTAEVRKPDVLIGSMTQDRFKLVENLIGATITNNLYGITWKPEVSTDQQQAVIAWLRSEDGQTALKGAARRQGAGLLKLEPGGLRQVLIPASAIEGDQSTAEGTPESSALTGK
ncbi:SAM-dependent methyltransferase [Microbacterium sp.]|uniref:SAM-dependent methyltransferase n=1 Tax=Microbacterium sp. TaxID=51671 RepID=UPI003C728F42